MLVPIVACLAMASGSFVQSDDLKFYSEIASIDLLQSKTVQTELNVTEAQRTTFNSRAAVYNAETKTLQESAQKGEITKTQFETKLTEAQKSLAKAILAELAPSQVTRLGQITLQTSSYIALMNDKVQSRLGLSASQKATLKDGWTKLGQAVAELERSTRTPIIERYQKLDPKTDAERDKARSGFEKEMASANEKNQPELIRLRKGFENLVDTSLTDSQKKTWATLKGPVFKPLK